MKKKSRRCMYKETLPVAEEAAAAETRVENRGLKTALRARSITRRLPLSSEMWTEVDAKFRAFDEIFPCRVMLYVNGRLIHKMSFLSKQVARRAVRQHAHQTESSSFEVPLSESHQIVIAIVIGASDHNQRTSLNFHVALPQLSFCYASIAIDLSSANA